MTAAAEALETALTGICTEALNDDCGYGPCWARPGQPCATPRQGGMHVARLCRAARHSYISAADLALALDALGVFEDSSVLYPSEPVKPFSEPGAGWTLRERWLAGLPAAGDEERARYREYECETARVAS